MDADMVLIISRFDQILTVFGIAYYLMQCFAGYKLIKISIAISSFLTGFSIGFVASVGFFDASSYFPALIGLGAGILLALLGFKLYLAGVFILCGSLAGYAVSLIPFPEEQFFNILGMILVLAAFIIVGILGVKFSKTCIILVTSVSGAISAVNLLKMPVPTLDANLVIRIVVIIILAVFGIIVQRISNKS